MDEEEDVWEVEERALREIVGDLPSRMKRKIFSVIQGIEEYQTENLSDS